MTIADQIRKANAKANERCRRCGHRRGAHGEPVRGMGVYCSIANCSCFGFLLDPKSRSKPNAEPVGDQAVLDGMGEPRLVETPELEVETPQPLDGS